MSATGGDKQSLLSMSAQKSEFPRVSDESSEGDIVGTLTSKVDCEMPEDNKLLRVLNWLQLLQATSPNVNSDSDISSQEFYSENDSTKKNPEEVKTENGNVVKTIGESDEGLEPGDKNYEPAKSKIHGKDVSFYYKFFPILPFVTEKAKVKVKGGWVTFQCICKNCGNKLTYITSEAYLRALDNATADRESSVGKSPCSDLSSFFRNGQGDLHLRFGCRKRVVPRRLHGNCFPFPEKSPQAKSDCCQNYGSKKKRENAKNGQNQHASKNLSRKRVVISPEPWFIIKKLECENCGLKKKSTVLLKKNKTVGDVVRVNNYCNNCGSKVEYRYYTPWV